MSLVTPETLSFVFYFHKNVIIHEDVHINQLKPEMDKSMSNCKPELSGTHRI